MKPTELQDMTQANETSLAYTTILADKNSEARQGPSPCNSDLYMCGINSAEEEEEKNVDTAVIATEKRPTWDANCVKKI